eukprot:TRINITY_DN3765_c0_g1_i4.p2 TRINITY_DN3765_c0_g1~~TRINITY_DN3765_c0_g1_i4.p2  ORF type:complete len:101 (-),score=5.43 TRINITY_DN3765_c0_g1_i4:39-341(-)
MYDCAVYNNTYYRGERSGCSGRGRDQERAVLPPFCCQGTSATISRTEETCGKKNTVFYSPHLSASSIACESQTENQNKTKKKSTKRVTLFILKKKNPQSE